MTDRMAQTSRHSPGKQLSNRSGLEQMTPTRFRECLALLGWSQRGLAKMLGWSDRAGAQWASGGMEIPNNVAEWLESRSEHAERTPPPIRTRQGNNDAT